MCYTLDPQNADIQDFRTLNQDFNNFYDRTNVHVTDFKLRTIEKDPRFKGSPMGLFLMSNQTCVHVHFQFKDTSQVGRINVQKYIRCPYSRQVVFSNIKDPLLKLETQHNRVPVYWNWENDEYYKWNDNTTVRANDVRMPPIGTMNGIRELLNTCKEFVKSKQKKWEDIEDWKMKATDISINGMFRSSLQRSSELMDNLSVMDYIEHPNDTYHELWRSDSDLKRLLGSNREYHPLKFDKNWLTALHVAAWSGKLVPLKYLVDEYCFSHPKICSIIKDIFGRTPLHLVCHGGHLPVVKYLVEEKNADITIVDNNGNTPFDIASESKQWEIVPYGTLPDIDSLASVRCFV